MSENVLIIFAKILKIFGYHYKGQLITFINKFTWLVAPKRKLKQISNLKKSPMAHLYQAKIREIRKQKMY